jgi:hypothetical protein
MSMRRYGQRSRSVLRGANAAPYVRSVRRKPPREVDWTRLDPGTNTARKTVAPELGYVVAISLTMETPPG